MINMRRSRVRWVIATAAGLLLAAGCGSNDNSADQWNSSAPSTPRDQLLLTPSEFPTDTTKLDLPPDKLQSAVANLAGVQKNATFTPAECGSAQQDLSTSTNEVMSRSSVAGATGKSGAMFVEFVSSRTTDLQRISDTNKRCADVSMTSTVEDQSVTATSHVQTKDVPQELKGANAIVYRSSSTATAGTGAPMTTTSIMGLAIVRGTTVGVRAVSLSDSVDEAALRQFFVAAVHKVKNAT